MWTKLKDFFRDANFHWKDAVLIVFIGMALMLLTSHISTHICQ